MCGIAGFINARVDCDEDIEAYALNMVRKLSHRGPDDEGFWIDKSINLIFAHRRLKILDLSYAGHQPMVSKSGQHVLVFNGEIYNHIEIRKIIENKYGPEIHNWIGNSDTETFLISLIILGIDKTLSIAEGMFAFALWDSSNKILSLGRDRLGEKPLYYGFVGNRFTFASELKAFKVLPEFNGSVNRQAVGLYLRHNYIPAPHSIYSNIYKLPSGSLLSIKYDQIFKKNIPSPTQYWSLDEVVKKSRSNIFQGSEAEAVHKLDSLLLGSVQGQMIADVPLGGFLSGGIDSSTVVALMTKITASPVQTFTVGFKEASYNEANYAKAISHFLGTKHSELIVDSVMALGILPLLAKVYDEPFSDVSQIPMVLVSTLARERVSVCLSGDGGDELFGGYNRYIYLKRIWSQFGWLPINFRKAFAGLLTLLSKEELNFFYYKLGSLFPNAWKYSNPSSNLKKLSEILVAKSAEEMYEMLIFNWINTSEILSAPEESIINLFDKINLNETLSLDQQMMYLDSILYLPDDILVKLDRAAMSVSLETRLPFLNSGVIDFAWSLPQDMKIKAGKGKWLLRELLFQYVPKHLIERPKMGFGVPIAIWLRGPLKKWANDMLNINLVRQQGFLNPDKVDELWKQHLSGKQDQSSKLWNILMFQSWLIENNVN